MNRYRSVPNISVQNRGSGLSHPFKVRSHGKKKSKRGRRKRRAKVGGPNKLVGGYDVGGIMSDNEIADDAAD